MERRPNDRPQYEPLTHGVGGGVVDDSEAVLLENDESPRALNIEFNRGSIVTSNGARKFGNQSAPSSGWRSKVPPSMPPLFIETDKAVPARGHAVIPYDEAYDIGGRFDYEGTFPASDVYHVRRGRSFTLEFDFALPLEEKLYEAETRGAGAPATDPANFTPPHGFDEALDDCTLIFQKAGDRTGLLGFAVGIVNIGEGVGTTAPASRPSNYALVLMWYDSPRWGRYVPTSMKYNLTTGQHPVSGGASNFCTQALRAIVVHHFVEPGRTYNVGVALKLDTGTAGTTAGGGTNTAWNNDGSLTVCVVTDGDVSRTKTYQIKALPTGGVPAGPMDVYKGPSDSIEYLLKYGVRHASRTAYRWGLGYRFHPWRTCGFIPFGEDGSPLKNGGFRMLDRSSTTVSAAYGVGTHTLAIWKINNGDPFVRVNHRGFSHLNTNGGQAPDGVLGGGGLYVEWEGLGGFSGTTVNFNTGSLRGYRLVTDNNFASGVPVARGAVFTIESYSDTSGSGGGFEAVITGGATINAFANAGAPAPVYIQAFRWNQRELHLGKLRIWGVARDYTDDPVRSSRTRVSLASSLRLDDKTEPDLPDLLGCWEGDDASGTVIREKVVGGARSAFWSPLGLGVADGGARGANQVFLSGEGDALTFDFSTNPVLMREMARMLASPKQGFAIEVTCRFTEAFYGVQSSENLPDSGGLVAYRPRFAPEIACWDVRQPSGEGFKVDCKPMIALTARGLSNDSDPTRFLAPLGFQLEVLQRSDQDNIDPICPSEQLSWYTSVGVRHNRYDLEASWVGKAVTLQFGVQPDPVNPNIYQIYLALKPKRDFLAENGDAGDAEMIYCREGYGTAYDAAPAYFVGDTFYLQPKDLARSVITIGGRWNPRPIANATVALGYSEMNCPMVVDEIRVFGTAAPGLLPPSTGATSYLRKTVVTRDGKLEGDRALPARALTDDELLEPVGGLVRGVNVVSRSRTVTAPPGTRFFLDHPRDTRDSVQQCYLRIDGDTFTTPAKETLPQLDPDFYLIESVAADGGSLTLATEYNGPTRTNARAGVFRLIAYTAFDDNLAPGATSLPAGKAYNPATATAADVVLSEPLWLNKAVPGGGWRVRLYGLGLPSIDVLPTWSRGLSIARRGTVGEGILALTSRDGAFFAAVHGALYQVDDRWRERGPHEAITKALEFRGRRDLNSNIAFPLHGDRVEFRGIASELGVRTNMRPFDPFTIDMWVELDEFAEYQTVLWIGSEETDPTKNAGTHRISLAVRFNRGRPELVIGATSRFQVAGPAPGEPEKGLFIAHAGATLQRGQMTHVRWLLMLGAGGTNLQQPWCYVQGKLVPSSVNAVDLDMPATSTRDWIQMSKVVQAVDTDVVLVGCARDSYKAFESAPPFASLMRQVAPQRHQGYLHSLNGFLSSLSISIESNTPGTLAPLPNFDPTLELYGAGDPDLHLRTFSILGSSAEGIGHRVKDNATGSSGVIRSSPFVSLYHEFGDSREPVSLATYGNQVFATNGRRIATIIDGEGMPLGVLPPLTTPKFSLQREPVWEADRRAIVDTDGDLMDPLLSAPRGSDKNRFHHRAAGNTFLKHTLAAGDATAMRWKEKRFFHHKRLWRPDSVSGRVSIWRRGGAEQGGPFIECRDGHLWVGWYDLELKREVSLHTNKPIFRPGKLYYIYVRKLWPFRDSVEGNFVHSYFGDGRITRMVGGTFPTTPWVVGETVTWGGGAQSGTVIRARSTMFDGGGVEILNNGNAPVSPVVRSGGAGLADTHSGFAITRPMYDSIVVREFRTQNTGTTKDFALDAVTSGHGMLERNFLSFSTRDAYQVPGVTCTGYVGPHPGAIATGGAAGLVTFTTPAGSAVYAQLDWIGMLFQWEGSSGNTEVYRITAVNVGGGASSSFTVKNERTGAFDNLAAIVNKQFGIFTGISLIKSEGFDDSTVPDASLYDIEMDGCNSQSSELSGFARTNGRSWCISYGATDLNATFEDARCFENLDTSVATGAADNDPALVGTEGFLNPLWRGVVAGVPVDVGRLRVDDNRAFYCSGCMTYLATPAAYTTTQPSETNNWARDAAPICTSTSDPIVVANQAGSLWAGERYVAIAFFDPRQNVVSDRGPILRLKPAGESFANPAGLVRMLLRDLPPPRDRGPLEHWIYESLSGGTPGALFRVAQLAAGSSEIAIAPTEERIALGPALQLAQGDPPEAGIIAVGANRLIAGNLTRLGQPDGVLASRLFTPAVFEYAKAVLLNTGRGSAISGLGELDGQVYAFKRDAVFALEFDHDGNVSIKPISGAPGCVSHNSIVSMQSVLVWRGERGLYLLQRGQGSDLGFVTWISKRIQRFFEREADFVSARYSSGALNRAREQYVLTLKGVADYLQERRASMAVAGQRSVFSMYQDPAICALTSARDERSDSRQLIGGDEFGFVWWLDREGERLNGLGADSAVYGSPELVVDGGLPAEEAAIPLHPEALLDTELEGARGMKVRFGSEEAWVMSSADSILHLDRPVTAAAALLAADPVTLGAQVHLWESKWFDFGAKEKDKRLQSIDLEIAPGAMGSILIQIFCNLDDDTPRSTKTVEVRSPRISVPFTAIRARWYKVRISSAPLTAGAFYEITSLTWRVGDAEQS